jgi:hypothetical protein
MCGNRTLQAVKSPSGRLQAVAFVRDCGAATSFSTQVSIVSAREDLPNSSGNVLVVEGEVSVSLQWQSDTSLKIRGVLPAQIYKQESSVSGIQVSYRQ